MKKFFCFVLSSFLIFNLYSNTTSSQATNRKTALRYLQLAKNYLAQNDWAAVKKTCENGLQYDDTIADLYYLDALSLFNLDSPRYEIIPVIKKSLTSTEWVDYNKKNARVFYADLLCSIGKPSEAMEVLTQSPLIYSSDAEYVFIKSLYELNTIESIAKAEERIESARRVYPNDVRFFYLFFNYEYNICFVENKDRTGFEKKELSPAAKKIAQNFIAHVPNYDKNYKDLEILASIFAEGENQKRLLKAFNARGFKHILYPIAALDAGIISEEEALDYFLTFIEGKIEAKILMQFYSMIKDEDLKKYFDEHLNAFHGTLIYDTNNSLEENLTVKYERGRAVDIQYDADNDQFVEWQVSCDFGVPKNTKVFDQNATVIYGTYPDVSSIVFEDVEPGVKGTTVYSIIDETYASKPFDIIKAPAVDTTDFYVIDELTLIHGDKLFNTDKIASSANIMDKPSLERKNARIQFSILNGVPYEAKYYVENTEYAHAYFTNNDYCIVRSVDKDSDGIFETTEYYSIDNDGSLNISEKEKAAITTNVWGAPLKDASLYLAAIQIDRNLDTAADFKEAYYKNGGVVTEWDSDFDGFFDIKYKKSLADNEKVVQEELSHYVNDVVKGKCWVTVVTQNGVPVSLNDGDEYKVIKGKNNSFYWINKAGTAGQELNVLSEAKLYVQGQMFQIEDAACYIKVITIGDNTFAKIIDKEVDSDSSLPGEDSTDENKDN